MTLGRRGFIHGVPFVVLGLSGCLMNSGGTTDISISNETPNEQTVTIQVTQRSDGRELLNETVVIAASATKEYEEVVSSGEVQVYLSVRDGPENTYEWHDGESDAGTLFIDIHTDSITFTPIVD